MRVPDSVADKLNKKVQEEEHEVIRLRWEKARLEQLIREKKQEDAAGGSSQ